MTGGAAFSSTTSFFSSTGDCAMIGLIEHDKRIFVAHNFEKLKDDFAKGGGEYTASFARMHGCKLTHANRYATLIRSEYDKLLSLEQDGEMEKLYLYLEEPFKKDTILKSVCLSAG